VTDQPEKKGDAQDRAEVQEEAKAEVKETAPSELERLRGELKEKEEQLKGYIDRLKHLQADFENYKKRVAREQEELARAVEDRLLLRILPIYDNLERAFRSYNHNNDKESFIEGMERIFAQFSEFLKGEGVRPIEALGRPFDPMLHEALLSVETEEKPNIVLEEFERGYLRGERVLRPSRVKVSRKPTTPKPPEAEKTDGKTQEQEGEEGGMD